MGIENGKRGEGTWEGHYEDKRGDAGRRSRVEEQSTREKSEQREETTELQSARRKETGERKKK